MAVRKMLAHQLMHAAAWTGIGVGTLAAAYSLGSGMAHAASLLPWR